MNILLFVIVAVVPVVIALESKEGKPKKSSRTGRQFGWQTPYTDPYNHLQVYGMPSPQEEDALKTKPNLSRDKFFPLENSKGPKPESAPAKTAQDLKNPLKLMPLKVNATLVFADDTEKLKKAPAQRLPSASKKLPNVYNNGFPNYLSYHQQPQYYPGSHIQKGPASMNTDYLHLYNEPNYHYNQPNYNYANEFPSAAPGHPSFGVIGQYSPSGGFGNNYDYLSPPMAIYNKPFGEPENAMEETLVTTDFHYECPTDYSFDGHVVGQAVMFPDPLKCNRFYYCHKGNAYVFACSENLYYNPIIKACDDRKYFSCGYRAI